METKKNNDNIVLKLKRQIGKMMVQVDFLYRNGRDLGQFDYDILMDRTRELYEILIDSQAINNEDNNFGSSYDDNEAVDDNESLTTTNNDVEFEIEMPDDDKIKESDEEDDFDDDDWEDEDDVIFHIEPKDEPTANDSVAEKAPEVNNEPMESQAFDDDVEGQHTENEPFTEEALGETGESEEERELFFERPTIEMIEESPMRDTSLAARLQRQPISDIKAAVSLNDRIMMIRDLFKGSAERYDKTISILNEFPTLGGAMIYMSELRIEFQWDTESAAYLKLQELVERRFSHNLY